MLSKDQLLHLLSRFSSLTSQPDVKKRIGDAVMDKQEALVVITEIQEEILLEMGIESAGLRISRASSSTQNLRRNSDEVEGLCTSYSHAAVEEMACDEAELEPDEYVEKLHIQHQLQEQQLEMLKHMRKFHPDDQMAILEVLHRQMETTNFNNSSAVLTSDQIQAIVQKRVAP
ncbi:hypothetical protein J5N97_002947 [Dioscorea zingiberensis]|uniref:Uncharacterized protein n=1 Tax=Dioscorea zingiberensis TaxID=325984 RepID=A0A9D5D394_9LILI|nr:hypothetical protein J5N97_002947 [Dioscorea zingiberensis]